MYDNTSFSLDLDESVGLMVQHPPKKQVTTKTDKKGKTVTLVTCYAVSPDEKELSRSIIAFQIYWVITCAK